MTLIEVLVVLAVLLLLAALFLPAGHRPGVAKRIQCANNLKQIGVAFRLSEGPQSPEFLMAKTNDGGTMEFASGPNEFRHFLAMTNELGTPKVLFCPSESDRARFEATTFSPTPRPAEISFASNSNLSYFVGINAIETDPQSILSGDRNLTNGTPLKNGILELIPNQPAAGPRKCTIKSATSVSLMAVCRN